MNAKYIRTKDFIAISELNKDGIHYCDVYKNLQLKNLGLGFGTFQYIIDNQTILNGTYYMIPSSEVIKQADTIEELCDFVFVKDEYGDYKLYDLKDWKNFDEEYLKESWLYGWLEELYYCIKTDKGLMYVAKLNKDGELELL